MSLTAREYILLPNEEQEKRKGELSSHECFLLRTQFDFCHFTEEEKLNITEKERYDFINTYEQTEEEQKTFNAQCEEIFKELARQKE